MGCRKSIQGIGQLVADRWIEKVLQVKTASERLLVVRVIVGKFMLNLISVYAPQAVRPTLEKEEFLAMLEGVVLRIDSGEGLLVCGDLIRMWCLKLMALRVCMVASEHAVGCHLHRYEHKG